MASKEKNYIQHTQLTSREMKDLETIEDGNHYSHGSTDIGEYFTQEILEDILHEWRLNVAICTAIGNE